VYATDEAMRRVRGGVPFRRAYREVAASVKRGEAPTVPSATEVLHSRGSSGGMGNVGLPRLRSRQRELTRWNTRERARHERAMLRLAGERKAR
jgi:argininosuccinate lyase